MAILPFPPRTPWRPNFPAVVAQTAYRFMRAHTAYASAKSGESSENALSLVLDCINDNAMQKIRSFVRNDKPRIVTVHAEELSGRNKIPMAYGEVLGQTLGLDTDPGIVQASVANHGGAQSIYHRLVSQPLFQGYVENGAKYLIIDDTCTAGGTLACLKGFIESNGGIVVGMSVLAMRIQNLEYEISLAKSTLMRLNYTKPGLSAVWREEVGHGVECLTEGEAGHILAAPTVDTIRNRLAEARRDLDLSGDQVADARATESTEKVNSEVDSGKSRSPST